MELKKTMREVRDRWKVQGLDIQVFFEEVLMNLKDETKPKKESKR